MDNTNEVVDYFIKLQKVIKHQSELVFLDMSLIKKTKIDDLLCCILAVLPQNYKDVLNNRRKLSRKLRSIEGYQSLFKAIKRKFIFNNNVYLVQQKQALDYITIILKNIEQDINFCENYDKK